MVAHSADTAEDGWPIFQVLSPMRAIQTQQQLLQQRQARGPRHADEPLCLRQGGDEAHRGRRAHDHPPGVYHGRFAGARLTTRPYS